MLIRAKLAILGLLALALSQLLDAVDAARRGTHDCKRSCGALNIRSPFRFKGDTPECGEYELVCEHNRTILDDVDYGRFYVLDIFYNHTIRLVDGSLNSDECSILPKSFPCSFHSDYMYFISCKVAINSSLYVDASPCANASFSSHPYFYAVDGREIRNAIDLHESCIIEVQVPRPFQLRSSSISGLSIFDIHQMFLKGYDVPWYCTPDGAYFTSSNESTLGKILSWLMDIISEYLYSLRMFFTNGSLSPDLYEDYYYGRIPFALFIITGGYGSVFKGTLRSGRLVAIKLLNMSKSHGQDFINEVATIGRIHHVNVVQLIGFCVEGSKQALVYDFMPNGSLDKIIFSGERDTTLCWEKIFEIAIGVARDKAY
ncbi:Serine-threonine/tyrosine-protein kinase [Theobroma cacao]|nr:Serine-threonine/tyrosine-protein kinase [Theobroma cacao]